MPTHKLTLQNLSHTYHNHSENLTVLDDISTTFTSGQLYAIRGESGSGKSTLLALLSGLDAVQSGEILYNKTPISEIGLSRFRQTYVNIVFQSFNLIPYLTAAENVQIALDFAGKVAKPETFLKSVGLTTAESHRLIGQLSGGQQQRVAIARALASDKPIIVADEPTGNLDEATEGKIIEIFQNLAHTHGKIVLLVTHSDRVSRHADTILTLRRGRLTPA